MKPSIKRGLLLLLMTVLISGIGYSITDIEAYAYSDRTILAFTSDVHNNAKTGVANENAGANRLQTWITNEQQAYDNEIDYMGFCGDMSATSKVTENQYWTNTEQVMKVAETNFPGKVCYTTGNHEIEQGNFNDKSTNKDIKKKFTVDSEVSNAPLNCQIYCMGSLVCQPSNNNYVNQYLDSQVTELQTFLNGCDNSKPVFILSHYPLHYYKEKNATKGRYTTNADRIIDALNTAADQGMMVVFLWGHNHTNGDTSYDHIFKANDSIRYDDNSNHIKTIKFTYAAAGCMSDEEYSSGSASVQGKGLIVEVIPNTAMSFTYYDANGNIVPEGGAQEVALPDSFNAVSFDKNDDLASGSMSTQNIPSSTTKRLRKNSFTKPCYNFNGWNTQSDGLGTSYADEASISITTDTTLYAQWAEGAHKWSFTGFTWTGNAMDGYTAASANFICDTVSSHTAAVQAALTTKVTEPTCTANGKTTYTAAITAAASKDGKAHSESKEVAGDAMIAHTLEHHAAVPATASAAGNKEYWECSVCHKHFKDAAGSEEYGNNEWIEPATGGGGTPGGGGSGGGTPSDGGGTPAGGGSGGGDVGGGNPTDEPPTESDPVIVSDPNSPVDVTVTIQDNTATVAPISKEDLAEVSDGDVISMDVSGATEKEVTSLCISTDTMKNIAESPAKGVEVKLDTATVNLDQKMMESLAQQAKGNEIKLQIDSGAKAEATLNTGQKETIAEMNDPIVVEANLTSGAEKISQFNGGIMTLSIQYVTNDSVRGWFLPDSGSKEPVPCSYIDHVATLSLSHCSHYAIEGYVPVDNQLTVKARTSKKKPVAVKAKKVKKAARQIPAKKYVSVKNPNGDVTYEKISGKAAFSVNTENGSIIVKKGTKKGTYKLKIKVTAAGDNTYKAGSKNVTCYVKVK